MTKTCEFCGKKHDGPSILCCNDCQDAIGAAWEKSAKIADQAVAALTPEEIARGLAVSVWEDAQTEAVHAEYAKIGRNNRGEILSYAAR